MSEESISVLLVEDDEDDVVITRHLLSQAGAQNFEVRSAGRLHEAFMRVDEAPPQIILLDLSLPDSQGWQTLVSTLSHAPDIPVVLLTGLADEMMGIKAVQVGAQDYLFKGHIDRDRLARAIRYAIERKRSELALKRYRDHLEEMVSDRTNELQESNAQLQTANDRLLAHDRARTEFVSNVSHELKTPLASMSYAIDNLLKGIVGKLPERAVTYLEMLKEDAQRLSHTVSDILDLSRIESNRLELDKVRIPLARLLHRTVGALQIQAAESGLNLSISTNGSKGFAECDPQKIERVILNVVRNAIKFTPAEGRVDVALCTDPLDERLFQVSITDNGIGIPEEHLAKVTERYFRVGEHVDGTGLGLAICKDIVELHGGRLKLSSPPPDRPNGTRVDIRLPKSSPPLVLAVDDCAITAKLISAQLVRQGYNVSCCANGAEALDHLETDSPDIIITDLVMPVLDGITMIAEIKSHSSWRHIPIIAVTGGELDRTKREILEGFSIPALAKPWRQEELLDLIEATVFGMRYLNMNTPEPFSS
jgi:signal transduction histidine kinase